MELNPLHRILLTADGSLTRILEAIEMRPVGVEAVLQRVVGAEREVAALLEVSPGEEVNYRVVNLRTPERVLVRACSYAALSRLEPEFRELVMRAEKPIGRIMAELQVESRREVLDFRALRAGAELAEVFGIPEDSTVLERRYLIVRHGRPLIYITESFPHSFF
ncbi:MAG: DUF98 domain-containing protein [Euryarchaeota archaeon]|nr:DUF98 domain-containing protein [Euryarchaeota archaeon]